MKRKKIKNIITALIILVIILYLFWGPLFPWNPIKCGYKVIYTPKATVYINNMTDRDSIVFNIDKIILEEEKFHNLEYVNNFKIIILDKESNMRRYLPYLKGSGYSVSISLVNLIYIGPVARNSQNGIEPYLKHELSHLLIDQNTTFKKAALLHEQGWLAEGVAEYFSNHSFYSKKEFLELYHSNNLHNLSLNRKNPLKMSVNEVKFNYTYYKFFIEFLIHTYGIEKFQQYLKEYIKDPENDKKDFGYIYNYDFKSIWENYLFYLDKDMEIKAYNTPYSPSLP